MKKTKCGHVRTQEEDMRGWSSPFVLPQLVAKLAVLFAIQLLSRTGEEQPIFSSKRNVGMN